MKLRVKPVVEHLDRTVECHVLGDHELAHRSLHTHYFRSVNFEWDRLSNGLYRTRLPFMDVTVGVVGGEDGALLVDTGTTLAEAAALDDDVRALTAQKVTRIVLTHKHFDHVLGSGAFTEAEIYCAPETQYSGAATAELRAEALRYGAGADDVDRALAALRPPDHRVHESVIALGRRTVTVRHLGAGHTRGDLVVVVPATPADHAADHAVVFCGDLVEESGDPAIDADSDLTEWPVTLQRLLDVGGPDGRYVPGHGAVVGAAFIRRQREWLANLSET